MNKVLDLVAAIEDDNFGYTTEVSVPETDEIDYLINCKKYFSGEEDIIRVSFDFDKINELRGEFEQVSVSGYVSRGGPNGVGGDVLRHEIEVQVKE